MAALPAICAVVRLLKVIVMLLDIIVPQVVVGAAVGRDQVDIAMLLDEAEGPQSL